MLITSVDSALERLVRSSLPLPEDVGDVSFERPDRSWSARQSRVSVNVFLFDVGRSDRPGLPPLVRKLDDGRMERRPALPLVRLSYFVTAWAGSLRDEHQLLGDLVGCLLTHNTLDSDWFPQDLPANATLSLSSREGHKPGDIISSLGGDLKPGIELDVTIALDAAWQPAATAVREITTAVPQVPGPAPADVRGAHDQGIRRRRTGTGVVSERTS